MKIIFLITTLVSLLSAVDATLEIIKKNFYVPLVSIEDYSGQNIPNSLKTKVSKLIVGDFTVSGHIKAIVNKKLTALDDHPDYTQAKRKKIDLVLKYRITIQQDNSLSIRINLFDINNNDSAYSKTYITSQQRRYPFLVHNLTIDLNDYLGAPPINWMQKFVIFSKYISAKESHIIVADYTLSYQKTIIKGGLNIFPKWADAKQQHFFYTKANKTPTLYKVDIYTAQQEEILKSDGMIVASDVSKDEKKILITMAPEDQTDIYLYSLENKKLSKITNYKGIDVNGNFIDNDKRITFVSDRLGTPNIFAKGINSSKVDILVHHGKNNNSATSFGNYIAYVSRESRRDIPEKTFNLYLISTKTDFIRALTSTGINQFPKFSSDGESILFIKHYKNQSSLGIIRLHYNESYLFPLRVGRIQSIDW